MKTYPADYRHIDFRNFVDVKVRKELSVWQGTEDIGNALKLLKQCLEDKQFIRTVLKEVAKDFIYEYDVSADLEVDGVTVTVSSIQWEVDVDSNGFTQSVNYDGDILEQIIQRDRKNPDQLTEEENSQYIAEESEIREKIQDEALEQWGNEYEIDEVFDPVKQAFIKHFVAYAREKNPNIEEEQIMGLLEYGIDESDEPYDIYEYASCIIKKAVRGIEYGHIELVSKLIHDSYERIVSSVIQELYSNPEFRQLEQEYLQEQASANVIRLNQLILASAKTIKEYVYKKVSLIKEDFHENHFYQPQRYGVIEEDDDIKVVDVPAIKFRPESLVPAINVKAHTTSTGSYYKTIVFGRGAKKLLYPSHLKEKEAELEIEPILINIREQGRRVHEMLKAKMHQVQRADYEKEHREYNAAIVQVKEKLPDVIKRLQEFINKHSTYLEHLCLQNICFALDVPSAYWLNQVAAKSQEITIPKKRNMISELLTKANQILLDFQNKNTLLLSALDNKISTGTESIQDIAKKFKEALQFSYSQKNLPRLLEEAKSKADISEQMQDIFDLIDDFIKINMQRISFCEQLKKSMERLSDLTAITYIFLDLEKAVKNIDHDNGYWDFIEACKALKKIGFIKATDEFKQITSLYEAVKAKPPSEFSLVDTTNIIYPCFIFCVKTQNGRKFVPVSLDIDGAPYLISGDPEDVLPYSEDSIRVQDKEGILPTDSAEADRATLVKATRRMQVESARHEDQIFIKTIGAAAVRYERETIESYIAQLNPGTDLGDEKNTGRLKIITGHSERVFTAALREPKVTHQLIDSLYAKLKQMQKAGEIELSNDATKIFSVSLLLYSDRSVCIHCTRAIISQMRDWSDGQNQGFMKLLVDGFNNYGDGGIFVASIQNLDHSKVGLRSNCIVVTDRIYAKYDGDPQANDLLHNQEATVVNTDFIDVKLYAERPTLVEVIGFKADDEQKESIALPTSRAFMSGSLVYELANSAGEKLLKETQEVNAGTTIHREALHKALVPTPTKQADCSINQHITIASASIAKIIEVKESILYILTEMIPILSPQNHQDKHSKSQSFLDKEGGWIIAHFISGASFSYFFPVVGNIASVEKVFLPILSTGAYATRHAYSHWKQEYIENSCILNVVTDTVFGGASSIPFSLMTGNIYAIGYGAIQGGAIGIFNCLPSKTGNGWGNHIASFVSLSGAIYFTKSFGFNDFSGKITSIMKVSTILPIVTLSHKFINSIISLIGEELWSNKDVLENEAKLSGDINRDEFIHENL